MQTLSLHPLDQKSELLLEQCKFSRTRRSGPGGQHRNKVESAIVILHEPTGVRAEASERRSQHENRSEAVFRLRVNLALEIRSLVSGPILLEHWSSRIRGQKISINPSHDDFPLLLAHALNRLAENQGDVKSASGTLQVSSSQLIKFLKLEPRAFMLVNQLRIQSGERPYH